MRRNEHELSALIFWINARYQNRARHFGKFKLLAILYYLT